MSTNWQTVYSTNQPYIAEMAKDILKDNDIEAVLYNQQDSLYLFGEIEIRVKPDDVIRAKFIIKDL